MFVERFEPLIHKYPREAEALERLARYFKAIEESKGDRVRDLKLEPRRLHDIVKTGSAVRLAQVIELLLAENILRRRVIVESPTGVGIGSFGSLTDVPEFIQDTSQDIEIEVTPDRIRTIYSPAE